MSAEGADARAGAVGPRRTDASAGGEVSREMPVRGDGDLGLEGADARPGAPAATGVAPELGRSIAALEEAAERLRADDLQAEEAAGLVERCADLAAEVAAALDRQVRGARDEPLPGQGTLL